MVQLQFFFQQMRESLSKQTKWMSSKDLYFLPIIKQFKNHQTKSSQADSTVQTAHTSKPKPIEQIIQNKSNKLERSQQLASLKELKEKKPNLYNKYESLPKIYVCRNRKPSTHLANSHPIDKSSLCRQKCQDNEQSMSSPTNKQNSFDFNPMYYRDHFNRRLLEETEKIDLRLNYNFSSKGLFLRDQPDNMQRYPVKYIRIQTIQEDLPKESLQKIPEFLMKLIQPQRHMTTL